MAETELAYTLITKAQLKTELSIDAADTDDDDRIIRAENAATDFCETHTNRTLRQRSSAVTEYHDDRWTGTIIRDNELWPFEWPITSAGITSLYDDSSRAYTNTALTDYLIYQERYIVLPNGEFTTGINQSVRLIHKPGYSTLPQDLVKAATLIALDFYRLEKFQHGNVSAAVHEGSDVTYKDYDIHPTAKAILDKYKRDWKTVGDKNAWLR